jgi:diguanylate cyclase (GGDEF)-like protein
VATILAVDDRAINREFLATLLAYAGYDVLQAADGAEALELVRTRRPDLVITDVLMPVMDGVEFADRVHEDPDIAHTPIIFYTATYRLPEAKVLGASCHVVGVLAKPSEPQAILDAIGAALGTGPAIALPSETAVARGRRHNPKLPTYLRDLAEIQQRLRHSLNHSVTQEHTKPSPGGEPDSVQQSFHSLSLRLATLLEFDLALASERDAQEMVELLCRASHDILKCKYAAVGILDNEGHRFQYSATQGFSDKARAEFAVIDPASGIFGSVIASGKPYVVHNAGGLPSMPGLPEFDEPVSSLLLVPVPVRSSTAVHGWLCLAAKAGGVAFEGEDEQFAITLAAQFALTFGNLTLYDEIQQHAAKLEVEVRERRRAQEELAHRMTHDQTTGLPRFVLIEDYLQTAFIEATAQGGRVMVFYVDIDRFHTINETRGRGVGDEVLRTVASRLSAMIGTAGQLAHMAADEFAFMIVDLHGTQDQVEFGEAVRRRIEEPMALEDQRLYVTCSVGVSCFPDNGMSPQELLRQAEAAMLHAKGDGRNTVFAFANEHKQELEERAALGLRLRDAIRDGQFVLHYQPQISGQDWQVLGFEALVRWQSPEFGLLPPLRFLGVAEELGLTIDIGSFVLESVCRQVRAWLDAGAQDFSISINVSSLQLQRPDFVEQVRSTLAARNVPAQHIELELTESMMIGNVQRMIGTMHALKGLGVKLALDDFGTGYSSLNYLRQFPIDTLKIDQSFVRDISSDDGAAGICRAIISIGHQLGMTVLAEGVETAAQVGYLRRSDCDRFQGFYFSKPVTAAQALTLLEHRYMAHEGLVSEQESRTLLLLDDEENILSALNRLLRRDGYRIFTATTVHQAFDILARNNVEVILSDQRMPEMSGTEFLSKVKGMYPGTVRIILSGYTDLETVTEAVNRGAIYKFLTKPWSDDELRFQIREAFRQHSVHATGQRKR